MVGNVCPRTESVDLGSLEQQQFLISTPVLLKYRDRILFDDLEGMCRRVVVLGALPASEAGNAEVIFMAGGMRAGDSDLHKSESIRKCYLHRDHVRNAYRRRDIDRAHVAMELGASLGAARGGLLSYYTHRSLGPVILH